MTFGGLGALAVLAFAAAWTQGGVGSADAAADPPQAKPAGLIEKITPKQIGRTTTSPTLQCPATPPANCADFGGYKDIWLDDRELDDLWTVPGDTVDFHAAFIACLPTNAQGWTSKNPVYQWDERGFPNPGVVPEDHPGLWQFAKSGLPQFPLRISEGDQYTNIPSTSDWTIAGITRPMHNKQVVSTTPQTMQNSYCGTRSQSYSVGVKTPSVYLMVFDPEITLKKYVCLPGAECSGTDPTDTDTWADAGTEDGVPTGKDVPGPFVDGQTVTWLIEITNTGTLDLTNVRIPANNAREMGDQLSGVMNGHETTCEGLVADELPAKTDETPAGVAYRKCTTKINLKGHRGGTLRNDAQALADIEPTEPMAERVGHRVRHVRSNADPAVAKVVVPKLKLKKEACIYADPDECAVDNDSVWQDANWPMTRHGELISRPRHRPAAGTDYPVLPAGEDVTWRITVTNIGQADLANVKVTTDEVSGGNKTATDSNCLEDPGAKLLKAGPRGKDGEKYSFICTTRAIEATDDPTINKAQATGTAVRQDGEDLVPLRDDDDKDIQVKSNWDTATAGAPGIKLKKYACATGTGCTVPASPFDAGKLDTTVWRDTGGDPDLKPGDKGYEPYDVKDRVWVRSGKPIQWLIVATNTGATGLAPVTVSEDELTGAVTAGQTNECATVTFAFPGTGQVLAPRQSTAVTCTTDPVREPKVLKSPRESLTNTAQASATPVDGSGKPFVDGSGEPIAGLEEVVSRKDMANVAAAKPHLKLKKYACVTGAGCTPPSSDQDAAEILAGKSDEWSDAQDSATAVLVKDGANVEWLILVQNDGTVSLKDVKLATDVLTIDGQNDKSGAPGCEPGTLFTTLGVTDQVLAPERYSYLTCSTKVDANGSARDVINTASASGQALNPDYPKGDVPLFANASRKENTVWSRPDPAHAAAVRPHIGLTKWVCEAGKVCEPKHYVSATDHGSWVKSTEIPAGTAANWLIVVTNTGNVYLSGVSLSSETLTAAGVAARASDGEECATAFGTQPLAIGAHIAFPCTSNTVALAESPLVNTATATGSDSFGTTVNSDPDSAQVTVPEPTPVNPTTPTTPPPGTGGGTSSPAPTVSGTPSPGPVVSGSPSPDPVVSGSPSPDPTVSGTPSPGPVVSDSPSPGPVVSGSPSPDPTVSGTPSPGPAASGAASPGPVTSGTPSPGPAASGTARPSPAASGTPDSGSASPRSGASRPALSLVKQVCRWGTACDIADDANWVAMTTQPAGQAATWRIVVTNTGGETLTGVTVVDRLSKTRSGPEASCQMSTGTADLLPPDHQVAYLCASSQVTLAESGLVNSASATATGLSSGETVTSPKSSARVLIEGAPRALPFTGATLGAAALAMVLLCAGTFTLWQRRGWRGVRARHAAG